MKETNYFSLYIYIYIFILAKSASMCAGWAFWVWLDYCSQFQEACWKSNLLYICMYTIIIIIIIIYGKKSPSFWKFYFPYKNSNPRMLRSLDWKKEKLLPPTMCDVWTFGFPSMETLWTVETTNMSLPWMATQVAMFYFWRFRNIFGQGLVVVSINLPH